jgi:succinoglycan biosynthesis protein ExoM
MKEMMDHITVCICTFKRPHLLLALLRSIEALETDGSFGISVCIVDNDAAQSAMEIVSGFAKESGIPVRYTCEPEQNIARARNRALESAEGSHIAFIDDDERPDRSWLLLLYRAWRATGACGVLGPVVPLFESPPPAWITKARILERPEKADGEELDWTETRTGNVLLERRLFAQDGYRFNEEYGRGGEDRELFRRMREHGERFIWCRDAVVREIIPPARWSRSFQVRRALLRGKVAVPRPFTGFRGFLKSCGAVCVYAALLPPLVVLSQGLFMRYLVRMCDHLGRVLAFFGLEVVRESYLS